ncbi:MAG: hypothetical protein C0398_05425, partial [Coprothermobacter sp.]|nr:hypothetical protein [Coprothermobacter sp.]
MTILPPVLTPKNRRLPFLLIALLTLVILVISVISLVSGWLTIFQNLFYLPIILACVYYVKRGFVFSVILACSYFFLMLIFSRDPVVLQGAVIRVLFFTLVAGVITYLSIVRIQAEGALRQAHDELEQRVAERTEELQQANEDLRVEITERKQAEAEKEAIQAQLVQSQKMDAIGQLAGGVAHDFNNLLTGILGNIALMRAGLLAADPLLEYLNAAETAARQAADLTKGLLTFSRSAMALPMPMNITAALDAALTLLKQSLPATIEIVRDYEQTAWNVLLDQSQMTQILLNLAVNARDAMNGKGTLTIRARNEVVGEEYLQTHPFVRTGEFVHLSVTDTGPGIPPAILEHLFEPFHTTKPVGSGTGLGLSIVYGAVKQAGGWITVVSTEGVGATFDIYLPRCLEEPMQSVTPSPLSVNVCSGTVLVVEDEPIVCAVAQTLLSRKGYTVLTAPDGASALNVLREHPVGIGLILLDMTMPGMTIDEIVKAIRALDPTVPILLNSGYTSNG